MQLWKKLKQWLGIISQPTPAQQAALNSYDFEEEALKRIKRIGELRSEILRATEKEANRRAQKTAALEQETIQQEDLNTPTSSVFSVHNGKRNTQERS